MKFYPKAFVSLAVFVGALMIAISARAGHIDPAFQIVGLLTFVVIELLVIWPVLFRPR